MPANSPQSKPKDDDVSFFQTRRRYMVDWQNRICESCEAEGSLGLFQDDGDLFARGECSYLSQWHLIWIKNFGTAGLPSFFYHVAFQKQNVFFEYRRIWTDAKMVGWVMWVILKWWCPNFNMPLPSQSAQKKMWDSWILHWVRTAVDLLLMLKFLPPPTPCHHLSDPSWVLKFDRFETVVPKPHYEIAGAVSTEADVGYLSPYVMNSLGENFSEIAKIVFFVQVLAKEYVYIHVYAYV